MRARRILPWLVAVAAFWSWWPMMVDPSLHLSPGIPVGIVVLCTGLAAFLKASRLADSWGACAVATFFGLIVGWIIWPGRDPIGNAWAPVLFVIITLVTVALALVAILAVRWMPVPKGMVRRVAWAVVLGCVAFGPVTLALTPPLIHRRMARNDRLAAARFAGLKRAVEQTMAGVDGRSRICDGNALKRQYVGPPFTEEDWQRITGNYVTQDGYIFMVFCRANGRYLIDAEPKRQRGDGSRRFCTNESGVIGCGLNLLGGRGTGVCRVRSRVGQAVRVTFSLTLTSYWQQSVLLWLVESYAERESQG